MLWQLQCAPRLEIGYIWVIVRTVVSTKRERSSIFSLYFVPIVHKSYGTNGANSLGVKGKRAAANAGDGNYLVV